MGGVILFYESDGLLLSPFPMEQGAGLGIRINASLALLQLWKDALLNSAWCRSSESQHLLLGLLGLAEWQVLPD